MLSKFSSPKLSIPFLKYSSGIYSHKTSPNIRTKISLMFILLIFKDLFFKYLIVILINYKDLYNLRCVGYILNFKILLKIDNFIKILNIYKINNLKIFIN